MYSYNKKSHHYVLYIVIALLFFGLGWQATSLGIITGVTPETETVASEETSTTTKKEVKMDLFWEVWNSISKKYVDEGKINDQKMIYGAIKGMVDSLEDPYTVFMTPEETKQFTNDLEGELQGIGAELSIEDKNLVIVSPLKNSPAEKAGLLPKDIIYKINGNLTSEMTLFEAIRNIRGEEGTTVTLTIIRENVDQPFDVSITRSSIDLETVTMEKLEGDIAYISINQFNDETIEEFNQSISDLILKEPKGLILDLRYNGGGYLDVAVDLLSKLLPPDSEAVKIAQRGEKDEIKYTKGNPKLTTVPLVVLVNDGSASASEIVAGAIQDHKRGLIMGTQTFGKGSVQEIENFADGSSIHVTIAKWFTPSGRSIHDVGLTPDKIVEISEEDATAKIDTQKNAATTYLKNLK